MMTTTKRRLPTEITQFGRLIATVSDQHASPSAAADAILAEYFVPLSLRWRIIRDWLIDEINEHRDPSKEECAPGGVVTQW